MANRIKAIIFLSAVVVGLFLFQSFAPISLNQYLEKTLTVRQAIAEPEVTVVHGCGFEKGGTLGGRCSERVAWAAQLYQEGLISNIIVSGGVTEDGFVESHLMSDFLIKQGVPKDKIFIEDHSQSTWQNANYSLEILKQQHWSKALLITSPFHSTRVLAVWQKVCPGCDLEIAPTPTSWVSAPGFGNRWKGLRALIREYLALAYYKILGRI